MPIFRPALLAAAFALAAPAVQAHNVWLLPSSTVLSKGGWITVDAAVTNDLFFFNHVPLTLDNLRVTAPGGQALTPENPARGKLRSVFDLELKDKGTYRLAVVNAGLVASYRQNGEARRWRGNPEAFGREVPAQAQELKVSETVSRIETFVTVGAPTVPRAEGRGLALLPETHPNDLAAGEKGSFRLVADGRPAAGVEVTLLRGGTRYRNAPGEIKATTDGDGRFTVTWPEAGMYWLEAEYRDDRTSHPAAGERRLMYSATLEVLPQ